MSLTNREREFITLSFKKPMERGAVMETFYPWTLTVNEWKKQGLPEERSNVFDFINDGAGDGIKSEDLYLNCLMADGVSNFEDYFGFDGLKRVFLAMPFSNFGTEILEETSDYRIIRDNDGWTRKYFKNSEIYQEIRPVITCKEDWTGLKARAKEHLEEYYTEENMHKKYGRFADRHKKGEYSIRMAIDGLFWMPRILLGIEQHLYAFYDFPEMLHDIHRFMLEVYFNKLGKILDVLPADTVYIMEDLSGKNGPMLSPAQFDEFIGAYYMELVPFLKEKGVKNVFVDTDGDFNLLIPNFIKAKIDGFLPMDVNAGMDIVKVRNQYPEIKLIGGFNKLEIEKGEDAIKREFERILPVVRQGGYIPGNDHQVPPSAPMENYQLYVKLLKEIMKECGRDLI